MQPQVPPTPPAVAPAPPPSLPPRPTFEDFKSAINGFNDSTTGVANRIGAFNASQVQPNFDYQESLKASNANLSALKGAAAGQGFVKQPKSDGGFDFFDPFGKKLSVYQYAQATGTDPTKVLADSNNSRDRQFVSDYAHINTIANALSDGDRAPIDKLAVQLFGNPNDKNDPKNDKVVKKFYDDLQANYGRGDKLVQGFIQYYPEIFTNQSNAYANQHPADQLPNYNLPADPAPQPNWFQNAFNAITHRG